MAEHLLDQVAGIAESAKKARPPFFTPRFPILPWFVLLRRDGLSSTSLFLILLTLSLPRPQSSKLYPTEELEWLAATAYNKAVDFYCASHDTDCRRWAEKALNIAQLSSNGGLLHELLQSKFMGLSWDRP